MFIRTHKIGVHHYHEALESFRDPITRKPQHRVLARWPAKLSLDQAIAAAEAKTASQRALAKAEALRLVRSRLAGNPSGAVGNSQPVPVPVPVYNGKQPDDPVHLSGLEIGTRRSPTARQQDFVQFARSEQNRDLTTAIIIAATPGKMTHSDIASAVGASGMAVLRVLLFLRDQGFLMIGQDDRIRTIPEPLTEFQHRLQNNGAASPWFTHYCRSGRAND